MIYQDRLYGKIEITEPVLLELMECPTMQRLKDIIVGVYFRHYLDFQQHSRFEHSVGVMCLLKTYSASLAEQIAGLIHDASHTAFSHTVDFIFDTGHLQNHQDNQHQSMVMNSDIPVILKKYGYDPRRILNESNFTLLETRLPDLCADRIDYAWRWLIIQPCGIEIGKDDVKNFLKATKVVDGRWSIMDFGIAGKFVEDFLKLNARLFCNPETFITYITHAELLKYGLTKGYISESDLNTSDSKVMTKLESHLPADKTLTQLYKRARTPFKYKNDSDNPDIKGAIKSRAIDPWVGDKRYSDLVPEYKPILEKALKPIHYSLRLIE